MLRFKELPKEWLDTLTPAIADLRRQAPQQAPCEVLARPSQEGFEIRLSYKSQGNAKHPLELKTLTFTTSSDFIVDHWFEPHAATAKIPTKVATKKIAQAKTKKETEHRPFDPSKSANPLLSAGNIVQVFEDQATWEKLVGSGILAFDFNSPELDRFRSPKTEHNLGLSDEPVERRKLQLPYFDLPAMDDEVNFQEESVQFKKFTQLNLDRPGRGKQSNKHGDQSDAEKIRTEKLVDGMNYVRFLSKPGTWMQASKALQILEHSDVGKFLPLYDTEWWALKGRIRLKSGEEIKNKAYVRQALDIWRDGLRKCAEREASDPQYLEYMVLESERIMMNEDLPYGAASLLTWAQRFKWSPRVEERFLFLRGEALLSLGLLDEAKAAFQEFFKKREDLPISASIDRRLVPGAAFRIGDISFKQGKYDDAINEYTYAINKIVPLSKFSFEGLWFPEDIRLFPHVLFNRAEAYLRTGKEQNALRDLRAFLFAAPTNENVGLVLFRVGDVLAALGSSREKVLGAWRECIFKVPETLSARLCEARKAAIEMWDSRPEMWPRLIGRMESALPDPKKDFWKGLSSDDLKTYVTLLIADTFIRRNEPMQAMFRLKPTEKLSPEPYLAAWLEEYTVAALAGVMRDRIEHKKYKEVIALYEENRSTLLYRKTRAEVLFYVARACEELGLWEQAEETLGSAEKVKAAIHREVPRPFDPEAAQWVLSRARIGVELLERGKGDPAEVSKALAKLDGDKPSSQRMWVRYARATKNAALGLKWWEKLAANDSLNWSEVKSYAELLKDSKRESQRAALLEKSVGIWFSEHEKTKGADRPPTSVLLDLAETRGNSKSPSLALPVYEYLSRRPTAEIKGDGISAAMISYKKGLLLRQLGRFDDARQSFEQAQKSEPNSVWSELASSAQKQMKAGPASTGSR